MDSLPQLASLLRRYNEIGQEIAHLIGRPTQIGHVGEYIAASVFDPRSRNGAYVKSEWQRQQIALFL